MKLVNADYGYDSVPLGRRHHPWWQKPQFPLVPMWDYRPAEGWNTSSWSVSWLFMRYWSLDHVSFEISATLDGLALGGSAFRIGIILPYTRLIFSLPLPLEWMHSLRRRAPKDRSP